MELSFFCPRKTHSISDIYREYFTPFTTHDSHLVPFWIHQFRRSPEFPINFCCFLHVDAVVSQVQVLNQFWAWPGLVTSELTIDKVLENHRINSSSGCFESIQRTHIYNKNIHLRRLDPKSGVAQANLGRWELKGSKNVWNNVGKQGKVPPFLRNERIEQPTDMNYQSCRANAMQPPTTTGHADV